MNEVSQRMNREAFQGGTPPRRKTDPVPVPPGGCAMPSKRHKHTFTALWWNFGEYGRQDVHVHSCFDSTDCGGDGCDRVLVGAGRNCDGKHESHHRETLHG